MSRVASHQKKIGRTCHYMRRHSRCITRLLWTLWLSWWLQKNIGDGCPYTKISWYKLLELEGWINGLNIRSHHQTRPISLNLLCDHMKVHLHQGIVYGSNWGLLPLSCDFSGCFSSQILAWPVRGAVAQHSRQLTTPLKVLTADKTQKQFSIAATFEIFVDNIHLGSMQYRAIYRDTRLANRRCEYEG